jgi:adenosylcobinamide kinase/adenosylcobinamide-phosphate guanylyltransferase
MGEIGEARTVIVDSVTLLLSNIISPHGEDIDNALAEVEVTAEIEELIDCMESTNASFIIVTDEVGSGLVPADIMSRLYRDFLGKANQMLAQHADEVYLVVVGIPLLIKPGRTP